jgi:hypothetical protein
MKRRQWKMIGVEMAVAPARRRRRWQMRRSQEAPEEEGW